ncbi:MAG: hypothetical protein IJ869_03725 [Clostridiales bacterium]|nr:hypothetical protein [Clostridiales bacterium]
MNKKVKTILITGLSAVLLLGGVAAYGVWDYIHRCVSVDPREDVTSIEVGKTYGVEDLFVIKRDDDTTKYYVSALWEDGSSDGIIISEEESTITVEEGKGSLTVNVSAGNSDSPEWLSDQIVVNVN